MSDENAGASAEGAPFDPEKAAISGRAPGRVQNSSRRLVWLAFLVAGLSFFAPLASSGIWDPPEREVAELGRRIALNLLGGHGLEVTGSVNEVPTRAELGRGELPFTSVALGFRLFGLHEWAGRLPLALWGFIGLCAMYVLCRRLSDARTAAFAVLVLATMPLYFLHARTMLGDIVTMAALSLSSAGLGLAVFDRGPNGVGAGRLLALGVGVLGVVCGVLSRGVLIGAATPLLGVGVSWLVLRSSRVTSAERFGNALGAACLTMGVVTGFLACRALYLAPATAGPFSLWLGSAVNRPRILPTFDAVILQLGHALFPWSAVIPVAFGAALRLPASEPAEGRERQAALRVLTLAVPAVAFCAYGVSAPVIGVLPFGAVTALSVAVALMVRDFERGAPVSRARAMVVVALAILLLVDFKNFPEKALSAFCVSDVHFPESFQHTAERFLEVGTLLFGGLFFFLMQERSGSEEPRFDAREYQAWPRVLRELWAGNLLFALLVVEAALVGVCLLGLIANLLPAGRFDWLGAESRTAALGGAVALPLLGLAPAALTGIRDSFRTLFDPELGNSLGSGRLSRWLSGGLSRAQLALFTVSGFGLSLSLGFYPLLAAQISPKQVFAAYQRLSHPGEALGTLGTGAGSASYYAGRNVPSLENAARAFDWLNVDNERRWLVMRSADLAQLNSLYRAHQTPARNLPVLDARSSEIFLVSNRLGGLPNENPLERWLLDQPPHPKHPLDANLGNELDVLGWDVLGSDGQPIESLEPGRHYEFAIYYRVVQPISGNWETFVHIDGFQRRFNADHPTLDGKYPFNFWHVGDIIADRSPFTLEPNFGPGQYHVYFGLFTGSRRLEVRRGQHEENRLNAGFISVR